jgi:hypothetical protein
MRKYFLNVKNKIFALMFSHHTYLHSRLVRVSATAGTVSSRATGDLRTPHAIVSHFSTPAFRKAHFRSLPMDWFSPFLSGFQAGMLRCTCVRPSYIFERAGRSTFSPPPYVYWIHIFSALFQSRFRARLFDNTSNHILLLFSFFYSFFVSFP